MLPWQRHIWQQQRIRDDLHSHRYLFLKIILERKEKIENSEDLPQTKFHLRILLIQGKININNSNNLITTIS